MDELFLEQRRGYELALDRLIRTAELKDRGLRVNASLNLEENTEVEYRNTSLLRAIYDRGLGDHREDILAKGNEGLGEFKWKLDYLGYHDRKNAFRKREDAILQRFLEIIEDYHESSGDSLRDREVEIRYLKNMVERQIHSRGLPGDVMIPHALDKELKARGLDVSEDYDAILDFSLQFVNGQGNNLEGEMPNIYLIVHDEHPISSLGHFPGGSLETLRNWRIIGQGPIEHYFLYFPDSEMSSDYTIQISRGESTAVNRVINPEGSDFSGLVSRYSSDEFENPKFAIASVRNTRDLIRAFSGEGYNIVRWG